MLQYSHNEQALFQACNLVKQTVLKHWLQLQENDSWQVLQLMLNYAMAAEGRSILI